MEDGRHHSSAYPTAKLPVGRGEADALGHSLGDKNFFYALGGRKLAADLSGTLSHLWSGERWLLHEIRSEIRASMRQPEENLAGVERHGLS